MKHEFDIQIESHLITENALEDYRRRFYEDGNEKVLEKHKKLCVGDRLWNVAISLEEWEEDQYFMASYKTFSPNFRYRRTAFVMIEKPDGEWIVDNEDNINKFVLPFTAEVGKVLNIEGIIQYVKDYAKFSKDIEKNQNNGEGWYDHSDCYSMFFAHIELDENGMANFREKNVKPLQVFKA